MAPVQNKVFMYHKIPIGLPVIGENIGVESRSIDLDTASAPEGGLITRNIYASFDPYLRGRMRDPKVKSYVPAFQVGNPITNSVIAQVVKSDTDKFTQGDIISVRTCPIEEFSIVDADLLKSGMVEEIDNPHQIPLEHFLGAVGMPGLTAYSSFFEIGEPRKGETIFISSAAGPVGALVGQLAKHEGLRVVGSVGDDAKLKFIKEELGFDEGFNYKKEKAKDALKRLCPKGLDIYYDNVGGEQLQAAFDVMNDFGRIVACGMISQYNLKPEEQYALRNINLMVTKRLKFQGFIVFDKGMGDKYKTEHQKNVQAWIADGNFKAKNHITKGIENAPDGLLGLFRGENFGKAILKIGDLQAKEKRNSKM